MGSRGRTCVDPWHRWTSWLDRKGTGGLAGCDFPVGPVLQGWSSSAAGLLVIHSSILLVSERKWLLSHPDPISTCLSPIVMKT